jgi:hypothetical protein
MTRMKAFLIASLAVALAAAAGCGGGDDATATPSGGAGAAQPTTASTSTPRAGATATTRAGVTSTPRATTSPAATATTRPGNVGTADWCVAGTDWGFGATLGTGLSFKITGIVDFKGKRYCLAGYKGAYAGQEIDWKYYFNEAGTDVWWVNNVAGQQMEQHVVGG